jgi:acid stress-induced BolA-like protein IbaG/YrbA
MQENEIIERIKGLYPDATIEASGADCNFEVVVVSEEFEGMGLLKRQRSILGLFSDEIKSGKLHALGIKTKTPLEIGSTSDNLEQTG